MKKAIFLLLLAMMPHLWAQYQPIVVQDSVSWELKHEIGDGAYTTYLAMGDTLTRDSQLYRKVYEGNQLLGYFREDSVSGKAWFWGVNDTIEYLIMDLSLAVNDSFWVNMYEPTFARVISVDTVQGRKTLTLDYHYGGGFISEDLKFIEGVGPSAALFYQIDTKEINYRFGYLVCKMYHDSSPVYYWDAITFGCGYFGNSVEEGVNHNKLFTLSPNPTQSSIKLLLKDHTLLNHSIVFYDVHGRQLFMKKIDEMEIEIDLAAFPPQVFFYKIQGREGVFGGKIWKE